MLTQPATHTIDLRLRTYAEVSIDIYTEPDVFICQSLSEPWKVSDGVSPATTVALRGWNVVIPALCTHYPLAELRVLRLTSKDPMHGAIDWTALSQLPSIREMEIEDSHWSAVAELSDCLGAPHSFPALETLVFNGIRWYRTHGLSFGTIQAHKDAIFPLLVAALAKRRTQGSPLKRLAILSARNLSDPWAGYREALEELEQQVEELVVHPHNLDDSDGATSSEIESDESADL
ncbi:uncharacterized protein PHACADRAFT_258938 [Phanerochaete carnosa HHB-10118-sp]|uniref:F-box domain-containing protein n=1 Tax=Phanerochaete carnosa (strain HHB-10118-sp) TaxID=650164 RepID=K5VTL4_PHACS|nr:uncharacterized protein PHACADRAFT_258938 [Phanerochaete carnosa HHB-10118-sp]EKM54818.1 hypothetical protein PHACADRAFT_258938 [Phanerochaete carnosa HHB-10118-sp]